MTSFAIITIIATISLAAFRIIQKLASVNMPSVLAAGFIYLGALTTIFLFFLIRPAQIIIDPNFKKGMLLALSSGIFIAVFDISALTFFKKGGDLSIFTPIVNGGSILIAVVVALLFLRESLNFIQVIAILAILVGIFLLTR